MLWITAFFNILTNILILWSDHKRLHLQILSESILDVAILLSTLRITLYWNNLQSRFEQTATAIFGSNVIFGSMVAILSSNNSDSFTNEIWLLLLLGLLIWQFLVLGHILRHAFDISLSPAIIMGVAYILLSYAVLNTIFSIM